MKIVLKVIGVLSLIIPAIVLFPLVVCLWGYYWLINEDYVELNPLEYTGVFAIGCALTIAWGYWIINPIINSYLL